MNVIFSSQKLEEGQALATFAGDTAEGIMVECDVCGNTFEDKTETNWTEYSLKDACNCPRCGTELFYGSWFNW